MAFEVFSIPMAQAAGIKRSKLKGEAVYSSVLKAVEEGKGTHDKFLEVRTLEGQAATVEQVKEYIYPTEYEPAEVGKLPAKLPEGFKDFEKFITPATPSAFDTKKLGDSLEVSLEKHPSNEKVLAGRVTYSHVSLEGETEWGEGVSRVGMPNFSVQKINATASLTMGETLFIGSLADPSEDPKRKGHVWVAFVRVTDEAKKNGGKE